MKTKMVFIISLIIYITHIQAQDYLINFTSYGSALDSVIVQNITQKTKVKVPSGSTLRLINAATGILDPTEPCNEFLKVYPNPITNSAIIEFTILNAEKVQIVILDLTGRFHHRETLDLNSGTYKYLLTGLTKGIYILSVKSKSLNQNVRIISQNISNAMIKLDQAEFSTKTMLRLKTNTVAPEVRLGFKNGDIIQYNGKSKLYENIVFENPHSSKTIGFDFDLCIDYEGNKYSTVKLGNQVWMVQNLKTNKYLNGENIFFSIGDWSTRYPGKGKLAAIKNDTTIQYKDRLYNWHAIKDTRKITPIGWRIPSDNDWTILENYLIANGYNYDGSIIGDRATNNLIAKSLASTAGWTTDTKSGSVGYNQTGNNKSNFAASPYGYRAVSGIYSDFGAGSKWWSSTESSTTNAWSREIYYNKSAVTRTSNNKESGFFVRCIRDTLPFLKSTQYIGNINVDNTVLYKVYSHDNHTTTFYYGSTNSLGQPSILKSYTLKKDYSDTISNFILDESERIKYIYLSINGIKDSILHLFSYQNDSVYYCIYKYNWTTKANLLKYMGVSYIKEGVNVFDQIKIKAQNTDSYTLFERTLSNITLIKIVIEKQKPLDGIVDWEIPVKISTEWFKKNPTPNKTSNSKDEIIPPDPSSVPEPEPKTPEDYPCINFKIPIMATMDYLGKIHINEIPGGMYAVADDAFGPDPVIQYPPKTNANNFYLIKIKNSNGCLNQAIFHLLPPPINSVELNSYVNPNGVTSQTYEIDVLVKNVKNEPFVDGPVNIVVSDGTVLNNKVWTNNNGIAKIFWTLGNRIGVQNLTVNVYKEDNVTHVAGSPLNIPVKVTECGNLDNVMLILDGKEWAITPNTPVRPWKKISARYLKQVGNYGNAHKDYYLNCVNGVPTVEMAYYSDSGNYLNGWKKEIVELTAAHLIVKDLSTGVVETWFPY